MCYLSYFDILAGYLVKVTVIFQSNTRMMHLIKITFAHDSAYRKLHESKILHVKSGKVLRLVFKVKLDISGRFALILEILRFLY